MNSLDRKLAKIIKAALKKPKDGLKEEKISKEFEKILNQVVNQDLRDVIKLTFLQISRPTDKPATLKTTEALKFLGAILRQGFNETSGVVFLTWLELFSGVSLDQVLSVAPNTICFGKWIKSTKSSTQEIARQLVDRPDQTYATIGADWLLEHAQPQVALPVWEMFLGRKPRPEHLLSWNETLVAAMKKNKRGDLLAEILQQPLLNQDQIETLSEVVRSSRPLFKAICDLLPKILARKDSNAAAVRFVGCLFDNIVTVEDSEREFITAALARLGTGILLADRRTSNSDEVLTLIHRITRQLRNLTRGGSRQFKTWVLESLCNDEKLSDGKVYTNLQGARYIALAFEKADQDFPVKDILAVTARYLGLAPIGKNGEIVRYEPLQHEDVDGGLVPGESVVVLESGWAFNEEAVRRAKVKRSPKEDHV